MNAYQNILQDLHSRYFNNFAEYSGVTSSFWKMPDLQKVEISNGRWLVKAKHLGDYRALTFYNRVKHLPQLVFLCQLLNKYHCPSKFISAGRKIARRSERLFSFDCVKHILSFHRIRKFINKTQTVCVIGDGYGFFSSFLKFIRPQTKVISVNLGRTLFFDVLFSQKCLPDCTPVLLNENKELSELTFIEAEKYHLLEGLPIDLFINIASMQEMDQIVIENYFKYMRSSFKTPCYFYCCNRVEKKLPDGSLIKFRDYPWQDSVILFDELCPWYQGYPSSRPPFWLPLDGAMQHRLVKLK